MGVGTCGVGPDKLRQAPWDPQGRLFCPRWAHLCRALLLPPWGWRGNQWRWGALNRDGAQHTHKARMLGEIQDCGFCPPWEPWGWRAGPGASDRETPGQPTQPLPLAEPAQGFGGQRRVCSTLRGWRLLAEKRVAQRESCLGRNEAYGPGDGISESSGETSPKRCGGGQYRCDLVKGECVQ